MNLSNNGHWRAEILPIARFGSNTAGYKQSKPGDRTDLNYDNDALDVLTELFDNADNNIPDEILNTQSTRGSPQVHSNDKLASNHTLPDSPPYSGSEAYSPDNNKLLSPSACSEVSNQSSGYHTQQSPGPTNTFPAEMNQHQQIHNHILQQQQMQQQQMQQLHERQLLQQHIQQQVVMQNGGQILPPPVAAMMQRQHNGPNALPQLVPADHMRGAEMPQPFIPDIHGQFPGGNKKRKYESESPPLIESSFLHQQQLQLQQLQQVKQEPVVQAHPGPAGPPPPQVCDYESTDNNSQSMDISPGMLNGGSYQPIKWRDFQKQSWCPLINTQGQRVNPHTYRLDGDKGFNFSQIDKAFVCQKKNHFQITSCIAFTDSLQYVMTPDGPKPVEGLYMHFYGVKEEAPNQLIQVDQSQADRSKRKFDPVPLHPNPEHSWKVTIGRLHFSDTTLNNMRKRGKPNPDQRYFLLVVGVYAHSQGKEYPIVQQCSEKLIVRASNPGQFQDSEAEPVKWQPGQTPNSVFHSGKVGINTDTPDEALTVAGNVKVMGTIMQPSDRRVKEDITEVDTKEQLKNVQAISLYNYKYTDEFADAVGLDDKDTIETGVIAQELEVVLPEAVKTTSDVKLPNGQVIDRLKVVDKNRLFMESLGAVKELVNVTDSLENKITYLERFNQKLKKLKRIGSLRSTTSNDSDLSHVTSVSTVSHVTVQRKRRTDRCTSAITGKNEGKETTSAQGVCSNRFLQILILILVLVMIACVGVIFALFQINKPSKNDISDGQGASLANNPTNIPTSSQEDMEGDPGFPRETTPPLQSTVNEWLLGSGCADGDSKCSWDHCTNQCSGISGLNEHNIAQRLNPLFTNKQTTDIEPNVVRVMLGTTMPQQSGSVMSYDTKETSKKERRRKRRQAVSHNPLDVMNIELTSPLEFRVTECLDCEGSYNFTYAVQVSHSFPATIAKLKIDYKTDIPRKWKYIGLCPVPREPSLFYDNKCVSHAPFHSPSWNVTPGVSNETRLFPRQGSTFDVEVGKSFKNVVIFRVSNYAETIDELCSKNLNRHRVEFRIWFMRVCYSMPIDKDYLLKLLDLQDPLVSSTSAPFSGNVNLDIGMDGKPV